MRQARAESGAVFIDTSGFYAVANRRDLHHAEALAIARRLEQSRMSLVTTNFVVAEAHALMLKRAGHAAALAFLQSFEHSAIALVRASAEDENRAREIILKYSDKDFSLTDAISFAVMQRLRLSVAFSFDADFRQFGFASA